MKRTGSWTGTEWTPGKGKQKVKVTIIVESLGESRDTVSFHFNEVSTAAYWSLRNRFVESQLNYKPAGK